MIPYAAARYDTPRLLHQRGIRQGEAIKPRIKAYNVARLRHHVIPLLGHKRVPKIGAGEVERFFRDVAAGKTVRDKELAPRKRVIVRGGERPPAGSSGTSRPCSALQSDGGHRHGSASLAHPSGFRPGQTRT